MLHNKYLFRRHFAESNFTAAERVHLNRVAVPRGSDPASQSFPQPPVSSLHALSLDLLPSLITHKDYIHVVFPTTYNKTLVPSPVILIPIHADGPSTSFQMSVVQPSPTAANTFDLKETAFSLSSVNINAFDAEPGHINHHSSPSKHRASHSLLKELSSTSLSELAPRKRNLYEHILNKESALCKLKKKYKGKKLKKLYDVESDSLMENL
jgi:hypothetical protein